ncbi:MASE3 domain-containing protein [Desulfospira joergensenii]|uniref:MASE3 domain-containing protein n=1 Tax=Desulfospira joergensenii TaxID=53329 RepID=UPI0004094968|nr:MASE3 domain-containing protein [Desulfospira joergensenii]
MFSTTPARILLITALALTAALLGLFGRLSVWQWQHIQLHSTIETLGGITACLISVILFIRSQEKLNACLAMLATGFASMGVLDTAHAISQLGDSFIFLHSVASLSCGFFFASVWFSNKRRLGSLSELRFIYFGFIILSISIGLRALLFPADVPKIMPLFDGGFTMAAVLINLTASLLFIASVFKFYQMYRQQGDRQYLLFACLAYLFGIAAIIFPFSRPWNGMWWAWHLVRLSAFFITLVFIAKQYGKYLGAKQGDD